MSEVRLIDANALKENINKFIGYLDEDMIYRIKIVIDNAPTVEPDCLKCKQYDDGYNYGRNIGYNEGKKERPQGEWITIADVMSVFDDFFRGDVDENDTETFLLMLKDKVESER